MLSGFLAGNRLPVVFVCGVVEACIVTVLSHGCAVVSLT